LGVASGGPRLRRTEKWENGFYGTYRGHQIAIERDHPSRAFAYLVICPDGTRAADGIADKGMTMREVIVHALTGALLWPNKQVSRGAQPTTDPQHL
jgi:hypothetical protein